MNIKSITASWVIALCLLGIFSLLKQPSMGNSAEETVIKVPKENAPQTEEQLSELEARAWCALDRLQIAQVLFQEQTHNLNGAMAIAPDWKGGALTDNQSKLIAPCIQQRLQHLTAKSKTRQQEEPVLAYLFTQL